MYRYFLLCLILATSHVRSQETLSDKTIKIWEGWHYSTPVSGGGYKIKKIKNYRTLSFDARFNPDCNYDLGNNHQNSWSKLMKISPIFFNNVHNNRLGWRFNLDSQKIETAFLLHIYHPFISDNHSDNGLIGHYIFPIHSTDLNVFNEVELIFDDAPAAH